MSNEESSLFEGNPGSDSMAELLQHMDWLRRLARRITGSDAAAEDAVQATWLAALRPVRRAARLQSSAVPEGLHARRWLARILRNQTRARHRSDARRVERERRVARPEAEEPKDVQDHLALLGHRDLVDSILALNGDQRRVIVARYWYGLTPKEIAERDGVPLATVRSRLGRAHEQLRERLTRTRRSSMALACFAQSVGEGSSPVAVPIVTTTLGTTWMLKKLTLAVMAVLLLCVPYFVIAGLSPEPTSSATLANGSKDLETLREPVSRPVDLLADVEDRSSLAPAVDTVPAREIDREIDLHGVLSDASGGPVPGALVEVYLTPSDRPPGAWQVPPPAPRKIASATADLAGQYRIPLERGRYYDVRATAAGGVREWGPAWKQQCQAGEQVNFVLGRACAVGGRVLLDEVGVPGIEVVMGPETPYFLLPRNETARVETDRHGAYRIDGLGPGRYSLFIDSAEVVAPLPLVVDVLEGLQEQDLLVESGRPVEGRVLDAKTGAPIDGVTVRMGDTRRRIACLPDGRFQIPAVRTSAIAWDIGSLQVVAEAPGYIPQSVQIEPGASDTTVTGLDIRLTPGVTAVGRVVDVRGQACRGTMVTAFKKRPDREGAPRIVRCLGIVSPEGKFMVEGLEPGYQADETTFLHVYAPGFGSAITPLRIESDAHGPYDCGEIVLLPALSLGGRVVDTDGEPCPHVMVSVTQRLEALALDLGIGSQSLRQLETYLGTRMLETDDLGRFYATGLAAGKLGVLARASGGGAKSEVEVELAPARVVPPLELVLPHRGHSRGAGR